MQSKKDCKLTRRIKNGNLFQFLARFLVSPTSKEKYTSVYEDFNATYFSSSVLFTTGQIDNNAAWIDLSTEYYQEEMLCLVWQWGGGGEQARQKKGWG